MAPKRQRPTAAVEGGSSKAREQPSRRARTASGDARVGNGAVAAAAATTPKKEEKKAVSPTKGRRKAVAKQEEEDEEKEEEEEVIEAKPSSPSPKKAKKKADAKSKAEKGTAAVNGHEEDQGNAGTQATEEESLSAPIPRSKTNYETAEGIPRNMTIPDPLSLEHTPKPSGTTRIASWNILSLKSSMGKGFLRYVEAEDADVLVLTETKCNDVPLVPALTAKYPHQTWGIGKTKGYAGIALLSKTKPIKVTVGLPGSEADTKGRIITAEYPRYILCGTYVVNAGEKLKTLDAKVKWNETFAAHLASCDHRKPTIWTGDLNVVLDPRDLSKASEKWNKSAGYTAVECNHHRRVLAGTAVPGAQPYVDIWRERNPDAIGHFSECAEGVRLRMQLVHR